MTTFIQILVSGIVTGLIYALIATGYTVLYTATGFVNFALGAQAMVGGYCVYVFFDEWSLLQRVLVSLVVSVAISAGSWSLLYRRVVDRDILSAVIMSFGFSIVLAEAVRIIAGNNTLPAPSPFGSGVQRWGDFTISDHSVGVIVVCVVLIGMVLAAFGSSRGSAVRAMFQDREMAEMLGIATNRVTVVLFAISGVLAAVAGILTGPILSMTPTMGTRLALIAFVGAVLGGLGSLTSAVAGAVTLGILEALFAGYVSADYRTTLVFIAFVVVLVIRPAGLFGTLARIKV